MIDGSLLAALYAIERQGSFDRAARELHVTSSAVSQRIRTLEDRLGMALVIRGKPCVTTKEGERLCRHAEELGLLERRTLEQIGALRVQSNCPVLRVAVNADSLATWFVDAAASVDGVLLDVVIDNENHSADWLRRGQVSAAVSVASTHVHGCEQQVLGALRYLPTASTGFIDRWFPNGIALDELASLPCLEFNVHDDLQTSWLQMYVDRKLQTAPGNRLPSSAAFVSATLAGIGWAMNPELLVRQHVEDGRLIELMPDAPYDVSLIWQWSRAIGPAIQPITDAVHCAAVRQLVQSPA